MEVEQVSDKARLMTLADLDGRTLAAKRARTLVQDIESDLGGRNHLTAAQRELAVRAAVLGAILADGEVRLLAGENVSLPEHLSAINAQRRVLVTLGLERKARDVTPDLRGYLEAQRA